MTPQTQSAPDIEANTAKFFDDLEAIRLSPEDTAGLGSREVLIRVPVRRPRKQEYIRCHPDPAMSLAVALYVDDDDGEAYFVAPVMRGNGVLAGCVKPTLLQLSILRGDALFIWPLTIPNTEGGGGRSWHESALKAKDVARTLWARVIADKPTNGYQVRVAEGRLPEPAWPEDKTFNELLEIAFADKIIMSEDHPVVRKLRGLTP
jgi:hypothetical protein